MGGNWVDCSTTATSQTISINGVRYIYFRAISNVGKIGNISNYQMTMIDTSNPTVSVSVKQNIVTLTLKDNVGVTGWGVNQSTSSQPSYTTISSTISTTKTWTASASGTYQAWIRDASGRYARYQFTIANDIIIYNSGTTNYSFYKDFSNDNVFTNSNGYIHLSGHKGNETLYFNNAFSNNYRYLKITCKFSKMTWADGFFGTSIFVGKSLYQQGGMSFYDNRIAQYFLLWEGDWANNKDYTSWTTFTLDLKDVNNSSYYIGLFVYVTEIYAQKIWLTNKL